MSDETVQASDRTRPARSPKSLLITAALVLVAFLVGFLWQWMEARGARAELEETRLALAFEELENRLATAVIQVDNGAYEPAREVMSRFFTELQENVERAPADARGALREILTGRDAAITALSRSDPDSEAMLQRMYTRFQVATGGPEAAIPIPAAAGDTVPPGDSGTAAGTGGGGAAGSPSPGG